jgi:hypothetical protein
MGAIGRIQVGIEAVGEDEYLRALTIFSDAYAELGEATLRDPRAAEGLSYFGLCVALVEKTYKHAIDLCKKAMELQFYHAPHYMNLARVYIASGHRKKAVEVLEQGLKTIPDDERLIAMRRELGQRAKPAVPFLPRGSTINVSIGRARHARKAPVPEPGDEE